MPVIIPDPDDPIIVTITVPNRVIKMNTKGNPGAAGTIEIGTVTTVEPGEPATVINVGTESEAVLNFEIPKGDPGEGGALSVATDSVLGGIKIGSTVRLNQSDQLVPSHTSSNLGRYSINRSSTSSAGAGTGQVVFNASIAGSDPSPTKIFISGTNADGESSQYSGAGLQIGDLIVMRGLGTPKSYMRLKVTGAQSGEVFGGLSYPIEYVQTNLFNRPADGESVTIEVHLSGESAGDVTHTGDVTGTTALTIEPNVVGNTKLADMAANTVKVRAAGSTGDPSDIALAASQLLGRGPDGDIAAISLHPSLEIEGTSLKVVGTPATTYTSYKFVDARDYGVVLSNATDSSAALQAALDACIQGGTVLLPGNNKNPNAIRLDRPVFWNGANQRVLGCGKQSTYLSLAGCPAFVTGKEPKLWPSLASYVDTDTGLPVNCRNGSDEFVFEDRFKVPYSAFATGGTYGAGGSGQPALETGGVPNYYGFRTRGVVKAEFPAASPATGAKKKGYNDIAGWEMNSAMVINLVYFAHGAKVTGGLIGTGQSGDPDPWILVGNGTTFEFYLALTTTDYVDRTLFYWSWDQPATNGLHRISIQLDLSNAVQGRLDIWQDRQKVTPTFGAFPSGNYFTTNVADLLKPPWNVIAPHQHKSFTIGSDSYEIGKLVQTGSQSDYTVIGYAVFTDLMFTTANTLTRLDAATVTDGNTVLATSAVYENSMSCLGTGGALSTGYELRAFTGSLFSTWGMITPGGNGTPVAAENVAIEGLNIVGQADLNTSAAIFTLPTLGLSIEKVAISGFFDGIGGAEGLISYPMYVRQCDFGSLGNHVYLAGQGYTFLIDNRHLYIGRRGITSSGSFVSVQNGIVNEMKENALSFISVFPGRSVGSGLHVVNDLNNQEGPKLHPKVATIEFHASYAVQRNNLILDGFDFGAQAANPSVLIDAAFPPGQTYRGTVEIKNCGWPPAGGPVIAWRGTSVSGYADVPRDACGQQVVKILPNPFSAQVGFIPEVSSPVVTRHDDFSSIPNLGGWVQDSHEIKVRKTAEGGVRLWNVKTSGTEGSNTPPVWEPLEFRPSANRNALSANLRSTLHLRVSAPHPDLAAPLSLFTTMVNDSRANLILQRVLTGSATFDRTNLRLWYEYGQPFINSQNPGSAVTQSALTTNNLTFWNSASAGQKTNAQGLVMTSTGLPWSYTWTTRLKSGFIAGIGSGSSPTGFCVGYTDETVRAFLLNANFTIPANSIVAANSTEEGSWCHYLQNMILDYVFGNTSPSFPTTLYFGLSTTPIAADGTGITEPVGGSYARVSVAANSTNFGAWDQHLSTWANKTAITFPAPTGDWGECVYFFVSNAGSGGDIVAKAPLNRSVSPKSGETAPAFAVGAAQFQV